MKFSVLFSIVKTKQKKRISTPNLHFPAFNLLIKKKKKTPKILWLNFFVLLMAKKKKYKLIKQKKNKNNEIYVFSF